MDMKAPIPPPERGELRKFAWIMAGAIALFFGLLVPWIWSLGLLLWPWAAAAVFGLWGLIWPAGLAPVYRVWMRFGLVVGWINSRIILAVVFYLMFTPIGVCMRLFGNDPMRRRLEAEADSYRLQSHAAPARSLERPY